MPAFNGTLKCIVSYVRDGGAFNAAETVDRSCETFYRPTQCLNMEISDEGGPAKERLCYCNVDYCNSATAAPLAFALLVVCLFAGKLTNACCGFNVLEMTET